MNWAPSLNRAFAKYPLEELEAIGVDHRASHTKAMAAQLLVLARTPGFHEKSGKPYCAMLVDMILDRTVGKPVQAIHVHRTETRPPAVIGVDKSALLLQAFASLPPAERPGLLKQMQAAVPPVIDAEPIEPFS